MEQKLTIVPNDISLDLPVNKERHEAWLHTIGEWLGKWVEAENFTVMQQAKILYHVRLRWDELSLNATAKYNHSFLEWARSFTPDGVRQEDATIRNKISVYRDYVAQKRIIPPVDNNGREIEFDPMSIRFSKLLIAKHSAKQGELSRDAWNVLLDNSKSVIDLKNTMRGEKDSYPKDYSASIAFYINDDVLIARTKDTSIALATIHKDNAGSSAWNEAMEALSAMLGAIDFSVPESKISDDETPLLTLQEAGVSISKNGVSVYLTISELEDLINIVRQ